MYIEGINNLRYGGIYQINKMKVTHTHKERERERESERVRSERKEKTKKDKERKRKKEKKTEINGCDMLHIDACVVCVCETKGSLLSPLVPLLS